LVGDDVVCRDGDNYRLTPRGEQLSSVMGALEEWGNDYLDWRESLPRS
jgi:DNA-binding HxlR family transcriptional regulator